MHRFWEINELVRELVVDLERRCKASASSIALACCSKQLGDVVLDYLWEDLTNLSWLMQCLPPDTWERRNGEFVSTTPSTPHESGLTGQQVFLRCPSTEEWMRFSTYARRIRHLHARDSQGKRVVSLGAFNLLLMQTPTLGQYLLPNLRSIHWEDDSWDNTPFLRLFLNPELVSVYIRFPNRDPHLYRPATVSLIPTGGLTHLQLDVMGNEDFPLSALNNLLDAAAETLRSVDLDGELPVAISEKLFQLPNLRFLDVELSGTRISPPAVVFPSLEKLGISYGESDSWLHTLQNIPDPTLRELDVFFSGSSPIYLQTLTSSLLGAGIERTLVSLECLPEGRIPLTEAGIRPLFLFKRLTVLDLISHCTAERCNAQLNDSIISGLAMALPQLTSLSLGGPPCDHVASNVTIASLVALSANCIDLDFLRLHFNANDIITRGTTGNPSTCIFACKLRTLSVGAQPLPSNNDDILLVTFAILHIFPHLDTISSTGGLWGRVGRGVQLFRKAPSILPHPIGS